MSTKKIVAVIGATGAQGGAVANALLADGHWTVRALTRKPDSDEAQALKAKGAEVVAADITKAEDLTRALTGVYAVFVVTTIYGGYEGEINQFKLIFDVAKQQHVSHVISSSLENSDKISGGKNKIPFFTAKALADDHLFASGVTASAVQIAGYYENFLGFLSPKQTAEGTYELSIPVPVDSKYALASVADLGHVVLKVLENKEKYAGKKIAVAGDYLTPAEIAATFSKVWGKPVHANFIPPEIYAKFGFPFAEEFADMFSFFHSFGYYGEKVNNRDIWEGKKVYPGLKTFEQFLQEKLPHPPAIATK